MVRIFPQPPSGGDPLDGDRHRVPEHIGQQRCHAQHGGACTQEHGTRAGNQGSHHGVKGHLAGRQVRVDLIQRALAPLTRGEKPLPNLRPRNAESRVRVFNFSGIPNRM